MIRRALLVAPALVAFAACCSFGCTPSKAPDDNANDTLPPRPINEQPIAAKQSISTLTMSVDLRDDGMLLHVSGLPGGSTLECNLDNKPLTPCHDGALLVMPAAGDHRITGKGLRDGAVTAQGQTNVFTVNPTAATTDAEPKIAGGSLNLDADPSFANGATELLSKDFTVKFKLDAKAPCDKPVMKCKYDSRTSPFWTACDASADPTTGSFTVSKDLLALGLQYLSVQASCGDQVGPPLSLFWWGVPEGYQSLALSDLKDANGRHFFNLVKADDCPTDKQKFECAATAQDDFKLCDNTADQPAAGFRVRMSCDGKAGPVLTTK